MDAYYVQHELPYYIGQNRQRGSGIGALVGGIARLALPFMKNILFPAAKRIGREFAIQALPEVAEVLTQRKSPREAFKQTAIRTARSQIGRGTKRKRRCVSRKPSPIKRRKKSTRSYSKKRTSKRKLSVAPVIPSRRPSKRSRLSFFSNINDHAY